MRRLPLYTLLVAAVVFLRQVFPTSSLYCEFNNSNCIDGLAQTSRAFRFGCITSEYLSFFYGFDAGQSPQDGSPTIKVSYWLQYDQDSIKNHNSNSAAVNRTTEAVLRVGNLNGWVGGHHNGCDGVWGGQCSESLKSFLQFAIYNLSVSGIPYNSPLETVLKTFATSGPEPLVPACPPTLFSLADTPSYSFINETCVGGHSNDPQIADPGNPFRPWRTWYTPNTTPDQQAKQTAIGIVARGPTFGSEPLKSPQEVDVEIVCLRAPKQMPPGGWPGGPGGPGMSGYNAVLGLRSEIVDAFDLDTDLDVEDDDDDNDEDCSFTHL